MRRVGVIFCNHLRWGRRRLRAWRFVDSALDAARGEEQWIPPLNHPKDQDLSLGTPVLRKDGAPTSVVG